MPRKKNNPLLAVAAIIGIGTKGQRSKLHLSIGQARAISRISDDDQYTVAREAITGKGLNVRELEKRAKAQLEPTGEHQGSEAEESKGDSLYISMSELFSETLQHEVCITGSLVEPGAGIIKIRYFNSEMYDSVMSRLGLNLENLIFRVTGSEGVIVYDKPSSVSGHIELPFSDLEEFEKTRKALKVVMEEDGY